MRWWCKKAPALLPLVLLAASLAPSAHGLYQTMRVHDRHYEIGIVGDETAGNPVFSPLGTPEYTRLHGAVYGIVNPAMPPVTGPLSPVKRTGDRVPEDLAYYTLDGSDYPKILEKLARETNATVVKLWVRGRSSQGDFNFVSDADAHAFCQKALSEGLKVILGYWWDTSLVGNLATRMAMVNAMWAFVDEFKHEQAVVAWGVGQVKEPTPHHPNHDNVIAFVRELAAIAAKREHHFGAVVNPVLPDYCYPRRPVTFTMGTLEIWGQLSWQPAVAAVPRQYLNFPDAPAVPAIPAACTWQEWTATISLGHTMFSTYKKGPTYYVGDHTRQRMRHVSWGEPVLTHTHTCVASGPSQPPGQWCP